MYEASVLVAALVRANKARPKAAVVVQENNLVLDVIGFLPLGI